MATQSSRNRENRLVKLKLQNLEETINGKQELLIEKLKTVKYLKQKVTEQLELTGSHAELFADERFEKFQRFGAALATDLNTKRLNHAFETIKKRRQHADVTINTLLGKRHDLKYDIDILRQEKLIFDKAFAEMDNDLQKLSDNCEKYNQSIDFYKKRMDAVKSDILTVEKDTKKAKEKIQAECSQIKRDMDDKALTEAVLDNAIGFSPKRRKKRKKIKTFKRGLIHKKMQSALGGFKLLKNVAPGEQRNITNFKFRAKMWKNIKEETGIEDINVLVNAFMKLEQKKIVLLKEANRLVGVLQDHMADIRELQKDETEFMKQEKEKAAKRKALKNQIEKEIASLDLRISTIHFAMKKMNVTIIKLQDPISKLHEGLMDEKVTREVDRKFRRKANPVAEVGNNSIAATENLGQTQTQMYRIENRIRELVQIFQAYSHDKPLQKSPKSPKKQNQFLFEQPAPFVKSGTGHLRQHFNNAYLKIMHVTSKHSMDKADGDGEQEKLPSKPLSRKELEKQAAESIHVNFGPKQSDNAHHQKSTIFLTSSDRD